MIKTKKFRFKNKTEVVQRTKHLSELPPNIGTPIKLLRLFKTQSLTSCPHLDLEIPNKSSFPLLQAVDKHGIMVKISHRSDLISKELRPIVLIGKGVCFDTGGINIKDSRNLHEMKFDKCGAMSIWATMKACSEQNFPYPVIAVLPLANNLIGTQETLPGSVIRSYDNLKRIEIRDTDAEGRLLLADAISFIQDLDPKLMLTVATLTGSCAFALGACYSGLYTYSDELANWITSSSQIPQDKVHRMPLSKWHLNKLLVKGHDKYADILNYCGVECGGSVAAAFLSYFVKDHSKWAHLDIAGTAWKDGKATGRPTRLLLRLLEDVVNNEDRS